MRRLLLLGLATLLLATGAVACGGDTCPDNCPGPLDPSAEADRHAGLYIAVLRRYLTTPEESSFGGSFDNVYVLDRTGAGAGDPAVAPGGSGTPFPADEQERIVEALADLGEVRFVSAADDVVVTIDGCAQVPDGILMTLGDAVEKEGWVEVGVNGFVACLGATWLTYKVGYTNFEWRVLGTTGGIAVA